MKIKIALALGLAAIALASVSPAPAATVMTGTGSTEFGEECDDGHVGISITAAGPAAGTWVFDITAVNTTFPCGEVPSPVLSLVFEGDGFEDGVGGCVNSVATGETPLGPLTMCLGNPTVISDLEMSYLVAVCGEDRGDCMEAVNEQDAFRVDFVRAVA